jgi:hypothetical protein
MLDAALPPALKAFAEREFLGERLIWAERPDRKIAALMSFGIWLFAIPWTAFSLFWESMVAGPLIFDLLGYDVGGVKPKGAAGQGMIWFMALFGLPFVAIGFGMLLAPFFALRKGAQTLYVLTNKRLAVLEGRKTVTITSIMPGEISGLSRKEGPDARGTLIVSQGFEKDSDGGRQPKTTELGVINDVRKVEEMVRGLKEKQAA